jgi:prepilin-type N-terminal cleavage/methylation domain-containing protein
MFVKERKFTGSPIPRSSGFTLTELLIVVAVIGILIGYAVPGFQGLVAQASYNRASDTLVEALTSARNEAIFNSKDVVICASDDPSASDPICSDDQENWSNGWIIYQECDGNLVRQTGPICNFDDGTTPEVSEPIISVYSPSDITLTNTTGLALSFQATGAASSAVNFDVTINGDSGNISVSTLARIKTTNSVYK